MSLSEHRQAIDSLDAQIVKLLNERTQHVLEIGAIKMKAGQEIYAPHRELAVLKRLCKINPGPITNESLRSIYREIMSSALALEKTMTIAYLGPEATFTHQAAVKRFGGSLQYAAQKTIPDVFEEVTKGRADYGVVPVENSTEGVVTHTLDMFVDSDLKIVAQIVMPIQHCFLSKSRREQINKLFTHPQAYGQCRDWLHSHFPGIEIIEASSTTRAAEMAVKTPHSAAIASFMAAGRYGLNVLDHDIQDNTNNVTRFYVLGRTCSPPTRRDRTSIMFSIPHRVGSLHHSLTPFRRYRLNMTKIESRPSKRRAWEYFFFVDCDGHYEDPKVAKAIHLLQDQGAFVKVLGSYPISD